MRLLKILFLGGVAFVALALVGRLLPGGRETAARTETPPAEGTAAYASKPAKQRDATEQEQTERKAILRGLVASGIFQKIEHGEVWVSAGWYGLNYEQKEHFAGLAYAYAFRVPPQGQPTDSILGIRDNKSGKRIGTLSRNGLNLD